MSDFNYAARELRKVMTTPGEPIRIKIRGDVGETRWMDISPATFDKIERIMIDAETEGN